MSTRSGFGQRFAALAGVCLLAVAPVAVQAQDFAMTAASSAVLQKPLNAKVRQQIIGVLNEAPSHGLPAYHLTPESSDADLTRAVLQYASAMRGGRMEGKFTGDWHLRPAHYDPTADFKKAVKKKKVAQWLQQLAPQEQGYGLLRQELVRYRELQAAGGWNQLAPGKIVKVGGKGPRVLALRRRLGMEYAAPAPEGDPSTFDAALSEALKAEQARLGVPVTGNLDKATVAALNVPVSARVDTIVANLERWRWIPTVMPRYRVEVNVPNFWVEVYRDRQPPLTMKVIVGKPATPTPMFQDTMEGVVFNPPWNVPDFIAKRDILPKAKKDKTYLIKNDYVLTDDGRVQQKAGPKSALGKVKFELGNPFAIYFHDTPSKQLFDYDMRAFSNGCMRLEKPLELLETVMNEGREDIDQTIATGETRRAEVARPVPVFVVYRTAFVENGKLQFRDDLYSWDAQLKEILEGVSHKT